MPYTNRPEVEAPSRLFRGSFDFRRQARNHNGNSNGKFTKAAPPEQTNAENFYYLKQMNARTPMVVVLTDGEQVRGWIEWYDRASIKVNREGAPNLMIQKHCIKYLYKQDEE